MSKEYFIHALTGKDGLYICTRKINAGDTVYNSAVDLPCGIADELHDDPNDNCVKEDGPHWICINKDVDGTILGAGDIPVNQLYKVIGKVSKAATFVHEGDEFDGSSLSLTNEMLEETERLRKDFESRTGLKLGSWVRDNEDGYKARYQGTIVDYSSSGGELQITYRCSSGGSWGCERHISPLDTAASIEKHGVGSEGKIIYGSIERVIKIKCPCCSTEK